VKGPGHANPGSPALLPDMILGGAWQGLWPAAWRERGAGGRGRGRSGPGLWATNARGPAVRPRSRARRRKEA